MSKFLKMAHFMDNNRMPQMKVRGGRVKTDFDIQGVIAGKFFA